MKTTVFNVLAVTTGKKYWQGNNSPILRDVLICVVFGIDTTRLRILEQIMYGDPSDCTICYVIGW